MRDFLELNLDLEMSLVKKLSRQGKIERGVRIVETHVDSEKAQMESGLRRGFYSTLEVLEQVDDEYLTTLLTKSIVNAFEFLKIKKGKLLLVGLGNAEMTADALGSAVLEKVEVGSGKCFELCKIATGVPFNTNIESFDVVKGLVDRLEPKAVIAVDSLATLDFVRLGRCFQVFTGGISAGSGVGCPRRSLDKNSLGVEVLSVGVPFVVPFERWYKKMLCENIQSKGQKAMNNDDKKTVQSENLFSAENKSDFQDKLLVEKNLSSSVEFSAGIISDAIRKVWLG